MVYFYLFQLGFISLMDDFVSKRLQIQVSKQDKEETKKHVSMIYTRLVDLDQLIRILIESWSHIEEDKFKFCVPKFFDEFHLK